VPDRTRRADRNRQDGPRPPARARSRERYAQRRTEVVDTAARVFAARGFHGTSIEDLVEATGLQRGGLYHYMDGKLDLLIAIHQRFIDPLLANAREVSERDQPADVQLRELARVLMRDIADYHDQVTVFLHEWRAIESDPAWREIRRARQEFEQIVSDVLERGRDEGIFEFEDSRLTLLGFLGMINYSYQWFDPKGRVSPGTIADRFADIFLSGIQASPSSRPRRRASSRKPRRKTAARNDGSRSGRSGAKPSG
jgi:TetR/AcrR family transcriptional regulator, cholesterol catabolism regulator